MQIIAIETSADETALSLLEAEVKPWGTGGLTSVTFNLLAHEVASQIKFHAEYGGIVPMLAKREHMANLPIVLGKVIGDSDTKPNLIAVTYGPGLEPALWTGINFAKALATKWQVPIVATDHMHGHIVSALLDSINGKNYTVRVLGFPAIALLISGGHTQLVLMKALNDFEIVGQTLDDAVGEAFDKVARILGLPYPGGPEIQKLAAQFSPGGLTFKLPRPMLHSKDLSFSFSGLKTAVLYLIKKWKEENDGELTEKQKVAIAHEFTQACMDVIVKKTSDAIKQYGAKSLLVGGGVIANKTIRESLGNLASKLGVALHLPDMKFTGDNATMIGIAALLRLGPAEQGYLHPEHLLSPNSPELNSLKANGNLSLYK